MERQISYKTMRTVVGAIAILLAPVVALLKGGGFELTSISISYWTNSGDIFVGALVAVGFFLFAYNGTGTGRDLEFILSKASCGFAVIVALFPTGGYADSPAPPVWTRAIANAIWLQPEQLHYTAAVLLFICLIIMMWIFSYRAIEKGNPKRAILYRAISIGMAAGIALILLIGALTHWDYTYLVMEIWGLTLFGTGWLIAGTYKSS